jgi:hypothetical protein
VAVEQRVSQERRTPVRQKKKRHSGEWRSQHVSEPFPRNAEHQFGKRKSAIPANVIPGM